jgi:hypothetical protein
MDFFSVEAGMRIELFHIKVDIKEICNHKNELLFSLHFCLESSYHLINMLFLLTCNEFIIIIFK